MKNAYIDFEYYGRTLISCALRSQGCITLTYWLLDPIQMQSLITVLTGMRQTHIFIGHTIQLAEARCFGILGLDATQFAWRDLLAENQWLRNCTHEHMYGKMINGGGMEVYTIPSKERIHKKMNEEQQREAKEINQEHNARMCDELGVDIENNEASFGLLDMCYFYEIINAQQYRAAAATKKRVRDGIIMSGDWDLINKHRAEITAYNADDLKDMEALAGRFTVEMNLVAEQKHVSISQGEFSYDNQIDVPKVQLSLGEWCARTATYANTGIQLSKTRMEIFLKIAPELTQKYKENWNFDHPLDPIYRIGCSSNLLSHRKGMLLNSPYRNPEYTKDDSFVQALIKRHCLLNGITNWPMTFKNRYSMDAKLTKPFIVGENIIKHLSRHNNAISSLKAFTPDENGKVKAMQHIDKNWVQHPDFSPHGAQTDRNTHKTKSFIFACPHWMRVLAEPAPGMAFVEVDLASGEVFIQASVYNDAVLKQAYAANDFYVKYAQQAGAYPSDLPIPTEHDKEHAEWFKPYKQMRQRYKQVCLSIQYGAGYETIGHAIAASEGKPLDLDQADALVKEYQQTYADAYYGSQKLKNIIRSGSGILLKNGWRLGKNHKSMLSALNFPIQGAGSCILQEACRRIDGDKIKIMATFHDSITAYCKEEHAQDVAACMTTHLLDASEYILGEKGMKVGAPEIIRHGDYWVHGKGIKDWQRYKQYFCPAQPGANASGQL
jgi:hypothetical protein